VPLSHSLSPTDDGAAATLPTKALRAYRVAASEHAVPFWLRTAEGAVLRVDSLPWQGSADTDEIERLTTDPDAEPPAEVQPFFADDFASGDFSHTENGASWGSSNIGVGPLGGSIDVVSEAARFRFAANSAGQDNWVEKRFALGRTIRSCWIRMNVTWPGNFVVRDEAQDNNKLLRLFWLADYDLDTGKVGVSFLHDSTVATTNASLVFEVRIAGAGMGMVPGQFANRVPILAAERGNSVEYGFEFILSATNSSNDGVMRMWKNGSLVWSITGLDIHANHDGWDGGYLMGWANSGYDEQTDFLIDDVEFYDERPDWAPAA